MKTEPHRPTGLRMRMGVYIEAAHHFMLGSLHACTWLTVIYWLIFERERARVSHAWVFSADETRHHKG